MSLYPTRTEPYLTVPSEAFEAFAQCGCRIFCDSEEGAGEIMLYQCSLHAAAPELLEHLALLSFQGRNPSPGLRERCERLVQRAKGEEV